MKKMILPLLALILGSAQLSAQPVITSQPVNQTAVLGGNATFSVMATGIGPLIYQWQLNGTNCFTNGIIATVAGNGSSASSGDGGAATGAGIGYPFGVAMDTLGNMYIADKQNNRIRKVDTNGIISTVAGNGASGFSGDGVAATNTSLYWPEALTLDSSGNLFFCDNFNYRVRKVDTNGIITTVAGGGNAVTNGGAATNARLYSPVGVAVDAAGNLFIADLANHRIRKVNTNGIISTVAGTGTGGFSGDGGAATNAKVFYPAGVALDSLGNLFITDQNNYRIREVDTNGIITTVVGKGSNGFSGDGGAATNALLSSTYGIFVDSFGYIFISDGNCIRQVDANGIITTVAGNGNPGFGAGDGIYATNASLNLPEAVTLDNSGNLLIADADNTRIRKVFTGRNPVLTLNNIAAKNAGNYQVIVTATNGSVTSSNATLTVVFPPIITTQPINTKTVFGGSVNLSVSVSGDVPLGCQWFTSSGRGATAVPVMSGSRVASATITGSGAGYSSVPQVRFVGGSGSGAGGTAVVNNGAVTAITITNQGSLYFTISPTIQIDAPSPTINAPMSGQTNTTLVLPAATSANATNYFVVVTNYSGSATSAMVGLTVFLPPQNFTAQMLVTGLQMQFTGTPSYPYLLQYAASLNPPISWTPVTFRPADTNGNWQYTDASPNAGQKFYRVSVQ